MFDLTAKHLYSTSEEHLFIYLSVCLFIYIYIYIHVYIYTHSGVKIFFIFIFCLHVTMIQIIKYILILHKDNQSKYKMQFWNNYLIY